MRYSKNGVIYTQGEVRDLHAGSCFPTPIAPHNVADLGYLPVVETVKPADTPTVTYVEDGVDGDGNLVWRAVDRAPAETVRVFETAVQDHLDATAQASGYDGILSAASYAAVPGAFQTEGIAYATWRSACWAHCYEVLAEVQSAQRPVPTVEQLLAELPLLVI